MASSLVWFRHDLRLADNPALSAAVARGGPVVPIFIWAPDEEGAWAPGAASRWWLHQSLAQLEAALRQRGSGLVIRHGPSEATLRAVLAETGADAVFWNRRYEPAIVARETGIKARLRADGVLVETYNSALLFEPWTVETKAGKPFQVFTPFWKACLASGPPLAPITAPAALPAPTMRLESVPLDQLQLEPRVDWAASIRAAWHPGEAGAAAQLARFLAEALPRYAEDRDRPDLIGTSRLSPHLHFGEMGPRQIWQAVRAHPAHAGGSGSETYLREIGWREFAHHLLFHFPQTPEQPLRPEFAAFPWAADARGLRAWQKGRTGYPIVDAGMRELWATGWMHNRVRMLVASFLVKDLRVPWQRGVEWFWDTLVDADLASNTLGWQWTAGCGADAAPYFRVFNPVSQGEKFDPDGAYVRRWVPELAGMPAAWIHKPWVAPAEVLAAGGVALGRTYPHPLVDHAAARAAALAAFATIKKGGFNVSIA